MSEAGSSDSPRWARVRDGLQRLVSGPTPGQVVDVASKLGIDVPSSTPALVAAVILRVELRKPLFESMQTAADIPDVLTSLEYELGVSSTTQLFTGSRDEVSAWFATRYMQMTILGLESLKPEVGDIVASSAWRSEVREVSSISETGRVYMKGRPSRSAWPNHLELVTRVGGAQHREQVARIDARLRNATQSTSTNLDNFAGLSEYELQNYMPSYEAVRLLEELLESGESQEEPFQRLITGFPELLSTTVAGSWKTFVIPKTRLGSELVTDFLVLGITSVGPQWVAVELEAARHATLLQDGELSQPARHGIAQIESWRDWLTGNVSYAQTQLGYYGLTNRVPGLLIIGRGDPSGRRISGPSRSAESARIAVHSWDWLLRNCVKLSRNHFWLSEFAQQNLTDMETRGHVHGK